MVQLALLAPEVREVVKDPPAQLVSEELTVWLDHQDLPAQSVNLAHLVSLAVPVPKVTWVALGPKVVKACKARVERQANPEFPVNQALPALPEKTDWPVTKVAKVKLVSLELLVSPVLAVLLDLPVAQVPLVPRVTPERLERPELRVNQASRVKSVLLDLVVYLAQLELLVSVVRSVLVVQAVRQDLLVNVVRLVEEVFQERMDPLDQKVRMVTEDPPALTDRKVNSEIPVVLVLLVCKDFVDYLDVLDLLESPVVLVNAAYPVLTAKTVNKDPRVSKVCPDLPVSRENVVLWERTAKMEILDRLEHLDLAVIPAKMELQVPKVLPVLLVPMANVVLLVLLDLVAFRDFLVLPELLVIPEKMANLVFKVFLAYRVPAVLAVSVDSLANVDLLVLLEVLVSAVLSA